MSFEHLDLRAGKSGAKNTKNDPFPRTVIEGNDYKCAPPPELKCGGGYRIRGRNGEYFYLTDDMLSKGLMLLGNTGCGKTNVIFDLLSGVIPTLSAQDTMLILDSKEDFIKAFYDPTNPRHILFSLDPADSGRTALWNAFHELQQSCGKYESATVDFSARELVGSLSKGTESSAQPFFNLASADIMSGVMASEVAIAAMEKDGSKLNNENLFRILSKEPDHILDGTDRLSQYKYLRGYVGNNSTSQALGVNSYVQLLKSRTFVGNLRTSDRTREFGMRNFIREKGGKILFLKYSVQYKRTLEPLLSLLFDLAIKEALTPANAGGNKWFICDEAAILPHLEFLSDLLNQGRSYGCKTVFGLQSYSMLRHHYSEEMAESLASGFCNLIAFQSTDHSSRAYVKERIGEAFVSNTYGGQNVCHASHTVTDSDIRNLRVGEGFCDFINFPVFHFAFEKFGNI